MKNNFQSIKKGRLPFEAVIDGNEIINYVDFINAMQRAFSFPRDCLGSIDRYLDWMRDLSWIDANNIIIKIKNSSSFMIENLQERELILNDFNEIIIPFWENEVNDVIVDGSKKKIQLYLAP